MPKLLTTLRESDEGLLPALAQLWGVNIVNLSVDDQISALNNAMLETERAELVWDLLDDKARGALQMLMFSGLKMPVSKFERAFGGIRKMGKGQIEREKPHRNPESVAEALYYRGFIGEGFEKSKKGMDPIVYVPDDLADVLPVNKTQYDGIEEEPMPSLDVLPEAMVLDALDDELIENLRPATTAIVDDMCTLLAYLRNQSAGILEDEFLPGDADQMLPYMLDSNPLRLTFLLGVGISANLITTQEGRAYPKRSGLQAWLNLPRSEQVRALTAAWTDSTLYHDLWHVPGLHPDPDAGFPYDPLVGREALAEFLMQLVPAQSWWSLDDFVEMIHEAEPDFQRPGGDYDSWYIRNNAGDYLRGFESWFAIEGALLDYYLTGPMHWLGLTDIAEDAVRLTAYGRAFLALIDWPMPPEPSDNVQIESDGTLIVSRKVSRLDRFQVARFSSWLDASAPYRYRLDANGVQQAAAQGITTAHITAFLQRHNNGKPLSPTMTKLLDNWESGAASDDVSFEQLHVLRTTSVELLDRLYDDPQFRRYLGSRLGPMAVVILSGQADALQQALGELGLHVEIFS